MTATNDPNILEAVYLYMIKIPHNRAVQLFQNRLADLDKYDVDLQSLRSRILMDVDEVFGVGSPQKSAAIGLNWVVISVPDIDKLKITYRQTLTGYINFINDFHIIGQEKVAISEEEYKKKYNELLFKWNALVPDYNKLLKDSETLRGLYDESLSEIKMLTLKLDAQGDIPEIRKILFLGASPVDEVRLRIDREVRDIELGLKMTSLRDSFELKQKWAVTADLLQQAMLEEQPQIVHFSGHGNTAGIAVEDSLGNAKLIGNDAIEALFELFSDHVGCVIMNSCYSESQAKEIAKHIPYVIGMKKAVPDEAAIAFSVGFYAALGAGKDIRFAFKMGVVRIKLDGISGSDVPVLLG